MIGVARLAVFALQHLHAGTMVGPETEIVGLVVAGFVRQTIGIMFVGRKARPAALTDSKQFRHQQAPDLVVLFLTQNVLIVGKPTAEVEKNQLPVLFMSTYSEHPFLLAVFKIELSSA